MRSGVLSILWLTCLTCPWLAQQVQQARPAPAQDGGVREVLESIVIPPIPNAPFTATLATESVKYSADGATMTLVNERHLARDAHGRVYEERWYLVPKNSKVQSRMNWIQIADPKQHTLYNCSTEKHLCDLLVYDPTSELSAASMRTGSGTTQNKQGSVTWEDLGNRNILGIDTVGVRETTVTNVGVMGNDTPLTSISEYWHSPDLGINLLSMRSSPFFGKQTFTITELTAAAPDLQLFELPAGYRVRDLSKSGPVSW